MRCAQAGQRGLIIPAPQLDIGQIICHARHHFAQIIFKRTQDAFFRQRVAGHADHLVPEGLLAGGKGGPVHTIGGGFQAIEHGVRHQIAVLPEHIGQINDADAAGAILGHQQVFEECAEVALRERAAQFLFLESIRQPVEIHGGAGMRRADNARGQMLLQRQQAQGIIQLARGKQDIALAEMREHRLEKPGGIARVAAIHHRPIHHRAGGEYHGEEQGNQAHGAPPKAGEEPGIQQGMGLAHDPKFAGDVAH